MKLLTVLSFLFSVSHPILGTLAETRIQDSLGSRQYGRLGYAHVKRTDESVYNKALNDGNSLLQILANPQCNLIPITGGDISDLRAGKNGVLQWDIPQTVRRRLGDVLKQALQGTSINTQDNSGQWFTRLARVEGGPNPKIPGQPLIAVYENWYSPTNQALIAYDNNNEELRGQVDVWSEVAWRVWADTCATAGVDASGLKTMIRHDVRNTVAQAVFRQAYQNLNVPLGSKIVLRADDETRDAFAAIVGSPNGKGVVYLLLNKRNVIRATNIVSITIELIEGEYEVVFNLT